MIKQSQQNTIKQIRKNIKETAGPEGAVQGLEI